MEAYSAIILKSLKKGGNYTGMQAGKQGYLLVRSKKMSDICLATLRARHSETQATGYRGQKMVIPELYIQWNCFTV